MDNKYLYNIVVIQIQRMISSRAFKNNGTWTSMEGMWLCERKQNHPSPEVGLGRERGTRDPNTTPPSINKRSKKEAKKKQ